MGIVIVEIKARCTDPARVLRWLDARGARYAGLDHQIDTYFEVPSGRLKLRQGEIENSLIHYHRPDRSLSKRSDVSLFRPVRTDELSAVLTAALPVLVKVDKRRHIYFLDNVKFHVDEVDELGSFVEIEAIDDDGSRSEAELRLQCEGYQMQLGIDEEDLISCSYSDLLLGKE